MEEDAGNKHQDMGTLCRLRFGRDPFIDHLDQILLHNNSSIANLHIEAHIIFYCNLKSFIFNVVIKS